MDQKSRMTQANEDYLEAVYQLSGGQSNPVRSIDLANKLGVTKASVNKAVSVLKERGYVTQQPYGDIFITESGLEYGRSVLRRHILLMHFLTDELGVEENVAEEEACIMEHAISDDTVDRLCNYLKEHNPDSTKEAEAL
ncbi:MAG: metal-dependent transcriptional regulator [Coriobacteriales bacterium]